MSITLEDKLKQLLSGVSVWNICPPNCSPAELPESDLLVVIKKLPACVFVAPINRDWIIKPDHNNMIVMRNVKSLRFDSTKRYNASGFPWIIIIGKMENDVYVRTIYGYDYRVEDQFRTLSIRDYSLYDIIAAVLRPRCVLISIADYVCRSCARVCTEDQKIVIRGHYICMKCFKNFLGFVGNLTAKWILTADLIHPDISRHIFSYLCIIDLYFIVEPVLLDSDGYYLDDCNISDYSNDNSNDNSSDSG